MNSSKSKKKICWHFWQLNSRLKIIYIFKAQLYCVCTKSHNLKAKDSFDSIYSFWSNPLCNILLDNVQNQIFWISPLWWSRYTMGSVLIYSILVRVTSGLVPFRFTHVGWMVKYCPIFCRERVLAWLNARLGKFLEDCFFSTCKQNKADIK